MAKSAARGDFLKRGVILIVGFFYWVSQCEAAEFQFKNPICLQPDFTAQIENEIVENPLIALLSPDSFQEFSFFSFPQDEESIQNQCEVTETQLNSNPKDILAAETPAPSPEQKILPESEIALQDPSTVSCSEGPRVFSVEATAERFIEETWEDALRVATYNASTEGRILLREFMNPIEKDFSPVFNWEEAGSQNTSRGNDLPGISATFPSLLNENVGEFIDFFQTRGDDFFQRALGRSQAYEEMMKKILREKNLPEELFYLDLIESGFNPNASSRARASGIWQFIRKTAKRFGLKVDKWVDERRDPEKSTYAAAEYLKSLYEMFNNWDLVAASYNAGEGKVLKAMKRAKSQDFWEISQHRYLKRETRKYVPMFLAAVIIASAPDKYGFSNIDYHPPLLYEKVMVPPATRLDLIAKAAETDLSEIQALNPSLRRAKTPPNCLQFEIKLPPGKREIFEKNFLAFIEKTRFKKKMHRVRSRETLAPIAKTSRVNLRELSHFDGLSPQDPLNPGSSALLPR